MNKSPIVGTRRWRSYSSEEHGDGVIEVEVLDHVRCPESWRYTEKEFNSGITGKNEKWVDYYGKDLLHCAVRLKTRSGHTDSYFASLCRSVRAQTVSTEPVYRTSCMIRDKVSVRYSKVRERWVKEGHRDDHEMMWELAGPEPNSLEDQVEMLVDESHRLFSSRVPVSI
jgi:hypothetical protein